MGKSDYEIGKNALKFLIGLVSIDICRSLYAGFDSRMVIKILIDAYILQTIYNVIAGNVGSIRMLNWLLIYKLIMGFIILPAMLIAKWDKVIWDLLTVAVIVGYPTFYAWLFIKFRRAYGEYL
jgi:hypothetical protein